MWHQRFLSLAREISTWSKDPSTQCGAVIVRPDRTILSLGFNGFPRGMDDDPKLYADREEKYRRVIHAEINAILCAAGSLEGCTLYTYPIPPCERCAAHILQTGIQAVVTPPIPPETRQGLAESCVRGRRYLREGGVTTVTMRLAW
jgi:dCMP deaminase